MRAVLVLFAIIWASPRADACTSATPFELFDRADRVVTGTVATRDRQGAFVDVDRVLKGSASQRVRVKAATGFCDADLIAGSRRLIFLDPKGAVVGELEGDLAIDQDDGWLTILDHWAKATDAKTRLEVLLELIEQPEQSRGRDQAGEFLTNTPALLQIIDAKARARIVKALDGNKWHPNHVILILMRLRAPELKGLLDARPTAWSYLDEMRAVLAADTFATVTDRAALAKAILSKSQATRVAALDRCEMVRGEQLENYVMYLYDAARDPDAVDWKRLAAACRR
ncbi:MAG: hypothetical protein QM831_25800 [Kofleriaceae bacterium]